jgi:uncharacterized protein
MLPRSGDKGSDSLMSLPRARRGVMVTMVLLLAVVLHLPAGAVTLDEVAGKLERNQRVYDLAGVLSDSEKRTINERLKGMEQRGLAEGLVVLVDRIDGATPHDFARDLAERWRAGAVGADNGFLILVGTGDRRGSFVTGTGLEVALPDALTQRLAREYLSPAFDAHRYGAGLDAMLESVQQQLETAGTTERTRPPVLPNPSAGFIGLVLLLGWLTAAAVSRAWPRGSRPGTDPWRLPGILLGAGSAAAAVWGASQTPWSTWPLIAVGLVPGGYALVRLFESPATLPSMESAGDGSRWKGRYWVIVAAGAAALVFAGYFGWMVLFLLVAVPFGAALGGYVQRIPRRCPQCQGALRWLPENEEAPYLREDENLEQALGSVDYDVWRCDACNRSAVISHAHTQAPYTPCPKCGRRTLSRRVVVDEGATSWSDVWADDISECSNPKCGYQEVKRRQIDRGGFTDGLGGNGLIILPPIFGGWGGGGWGGGGGWTGGGDWGGQGDSGGGSWDVGGIDVGDLGGSGDFGGGGSDFDW